MDAASPALSLIYGGLACSVAEAVTIPLDVLKVRMQLQGDGGGARQYRNSLDAVFKIWTAEGPLAFTKGLAPAVLRQLSYGSLRFGLYAPCKQLYGISPHQNTQPALLKKMLAGMTSGGVSALICNPIDLVKVRMQADGLRRDAPPSYTSVVFAFRQIRRQEGWLGLYKGVAPSTCRAAVVCAAEISTYDEIKCWFLRHRLLADGIHLHFVTAMMTGFLSTLASCPFDVVKSRLMSQSIDKNGLGTRYAGMFDCFIKSFKAEGPTFLYRGFWPTYVNKGPTVVLMYTLYEQLRLRGDKWLDRFARRDGTVTMRSPAPLRGVMV